MKLVEMNWNPSDRQLRQFGVVALVALPALAWFWSGGRPTVVLPLAAAGLASAALGLFRPRALRPIFVLLSLLALPVGLVVSELTMALLFYGVFLPIGMVFRLLGRDSLQRKFEPEATTYWQPKRQPADTADYFRQW
jgi:hypothetical protein